MNMKCLKDILVRLDSVLSAQDGSRTELCVPFGKYNGSAVSICAVVSDLNVKSVWLLYGASQIFDLSTDEGFDQWWYLLSADAFEAATGGLVTRYVDSLFFYFESDTIEMRMTVNYLRQSSSGGGLDTSVRTFRVFFERRR
jgi:hypothetical protein